MNALEGNRLYVIDYNWLEVKEYEIVKETPRRIYYKDVGSCYKGGYYYDKYKWDGPNKNLFADPLKALDVLDSVIARRTWQTKGATASCGGAETGDSHLTAAAERCGQPLNMR